MRKRPIYFVALSAAVGLLSWINVHGQGAGKPKTQAEIEAWSQAHPEQATAPAPALSNQPSNRSATPTEQPAMVQSAKAKQDAEKELQTSPASNEPKSETKVVNSVSSYQPIMKDSEIPAQYRQAVDYQDPAVRERLEADLKQQNVKAKSSEINEIRPFEAVTAPERKPDFSPNKSMATRETRSLPVGFPVYVDTGNPDQDAATYQAAKAKYYAEHPEGVDNGSAKAAEEHRAAYEADLARKRAEMNQQGQ